MSALDNKQLAVDFLKAMHSGDHEAGASMLTDDCEFFLAGDMAKSGRLSAAGGLAIWAGITNAIQGGTFNFGHVTAEQDRVSIEAESFGTINDVAFHNQHHFLIRVRNGKIYQFKEYFDTLHVWEIINSMFFDGMPRAQRTSNIDEITDSISK
ncbi:nuclear transport factor 2 family protein [Mycobacterium sp.]|uniref:nuclear transport factor 2 family protein n=1 Tax=Mycobacterium sp. TaxID=1785 RepID=UPI003A86727F